MAQNRQPFDTEASEIIGVNGKSLAPPQTSGKQHGFKTKESMAFEPKFAPIAERPGQFPKSSYPQEQQQLPMSRQPLGPGGSSGLMFASQNAGPQPFMRSNTDYDRYRSGPEIAAMASQQEAQRRFSNVAPMSGQGPSYQPQTSPGLFGPPGPGQFSPDHRQSELPPDFFSDMPPPFANQASMGFGNPSHFGSQPQFGFHQMQGPGGLGFSARNNSYAPAYTNSTACGRSGGLTDAYAQMQAQHGNDPYFYRKLNFDSQNFQKASSQAGQGGQISDAVLRQFFNHYAPQGRIDANNFPRLIQEIFTFENRPIPNYMACLYLMSKYDRNQDGLIDYEEFKLMTAEL